MSRPSTDMPDTGRVLQNDFVKSAVSRWYELGTGRVYYERDLVKTIARVRAQKSLDITDEVVEAYDAEPAPKPKAPAAEPAP